MCERAECDAVKSVEGRGGGTHRKSENTVPIKIRFGQKTFQIYTVQQIIALCYIKYINFFLRSDLLRLPTAIL